MSKRGIRATTAVLILLCVSVTTVTAYRQEKEFEAATDELTQQISDTQKENKLLNRQLNEAEALIQAQCYLINEFMTGKPKEEQQEEKAGRGTERGERRMMEVTAYDLSYQSCQKYPDDPLYGITASGKHVEEWNTIAAGPELPFGIKVYIPFFADKPNGGVFTVEDRGGGVKNGRIDVYMESYEACMEFGRQQLEVYVLK